MGSAMVLQEAVFTVFFCAFVVQYFASAEAEDAAATEVPCHAAERAILAIFNTASHTPPHTPPQSPYHFRRTRRWWHRVVSWRASSGSTCRPPLVLLPLRRPRKNRKVALSHDLLVLEFPVLLFYCAEANPAVFSKA